MYIEFGDSHGLQLLNAHTATALLLNLEISLLLLVSFISCSSARSQLFSTNLYADEVKQHLAGLWMMVVLSRQGSILSKNQCQGQNFMACTNLHGDMGAVQKSVLGLNPGGKSSHLLLRLIIVKMLLLIMHSTINLFSCLHMWDAN